MDTIFRNSFFNDVIPPAVLPYMSLIIIVLITFAAKFILDWYLNTRSGYLLRAVGDNDLLVTVLAKDKGSVKIVGLAIANGLTALAGSVFVQRYRAFDISLGVGTVVIGLASVIVGIAIVRRLPLLKVTTTVVVGAVLYRACVAMAVSAGMPASDLKFITAALLLVILVLSWERTKKRVKARA
jgi:putative ABC transport system permease protein